MYLCRAASQALAARLCRAPSAASRLKQRAPLRQMSSGSVPGSSGENMIYYLITGVAAFGALFYTYKVVSSSHSNYIEHMNVLHERGQKHKADSYKEGDEEETAEVTGADVATEEADTATAAGPAAQEESSGVTPETGGEGDLPAADTSTAVEGTQQEAAANSEAPAAQETVSEVLDVAASSTHEENLDSVKEGVASAAQEMSDTATRNQDADAEESGRASEGAGVQLVSEEEKSPEEVAKEP
ncbi:protein MGARP isoform X1 [Coturnix japonica]|uniref:protein MGARP isoform X1 n=1 Tax=Coturnix japonica TaxID=93934 RepID=UPI000776DD36|nr:protein MGARP isoform X1 [Coturnix japonica]